VVGEDDVVTDPGDIDAVSRPSAKVLLVDDDGRVLLFSGVDRTKPDMAPWWFPVGGALEPGEDPAVGAIREVREETGLEIGHPGEVVMTRHLQWTFEGQRFDQHESYFCVRIDRFDLDTSGWTDTERATMGEHRWWSVDELRSTDAQVFPEGLADLLDRLLAA
jgi:8-oxo-dGTP pyrophosphatase MutT (NUDIX family)